MLFLREKLHLIGEMANILGRSSSGI